MRKFSISIAALTLVAAVAAPALSATSTRRATEDYRLTQGMVISDSTTVGWSIGSAWLTFRPKPGERFVSLSVADEVGQDVYGHVHIDSNGDGRDEQLVFCNETDRPIDLGSARKFKVAVFLGTCPDGSTPSIATTGTVTAHFSR